MRGAPEHLAGTIAMPFMIGPGTISAAVVTGMGVPYWGNGCDRVTLIL